MFPKKLRTILRVTAVYDDDYVDVNIPAWDPERVITIAKHLLDLQNDEEAVPNSWFYCYVNFNELSSEKVIASKLQALDRPRPYKFPGFSS